MNKWIGIGRLTRDPDVRVSASGVSVARFTLAIDRETREKATDFISIVAFGDSANFCEKYFHKGMKIAVEGRIQTGSYPDKDSGKTVYTTDIVYTRGEFCEKKEAPSVSDDGKFMNVPDDIDEELPFPMPVR